MKLLEIQIANGYSSEAEAERSAAKFTPHRDSSEFFAVLERTMKADPMQ
jgi:hypothetical protein